MIGVAHLRVRGRAAVLAGLWCVATVVTGAVVLHFRGTAGPPVEAAAVAVALLLATNVALLRWLGPVPVETLAGAAPVTRRGPAVLTVAAAVVALVGVGLTGPYALVALALAAVAVLALQVRSLPRGAATWAVGFGAVAALAGVADAVAAGASAPVALSAIARLPLVTVTLLAGWALARSGGWTASGIGPAAVLTGGPQPGLRAFALGVLLATPWALGNIVGGPVAGDDVRLAWQPLAAALQPAVAEEAWARVFLVALLYALFRRHARAGGALHAAAIVAMLWFAFLHDPAQPLTTVFIAAVFALPMTYLWLRRGLEAAIGFHFAVDLARYAAAYWALQGIG